jgi:hypothetical protein
MHFRNLKLKFFGTEISRLNSSPQKFSSTKNV